MAKSSSLPAAIYARISRDAEEKRVGVERQEADCRALADRLGWDVVGVFVDNDISAYSGKARPQYRAMLEAVRAGEVHGVLAYHTDRLHRRVADLEEFVKVAEAYDLQVETVSSGNLNLSTPEGRMVARMLGAAAQHEVERTKARVKRAKAQNALDGEYRGGVRPFGYQKGGMEVDEAEAKMVLDATRAILAGRSLAAIAKEWNAKGSTGTLGRPWTYNNLRDMLLRPRNAGLVAKGLPGRKGRGAAEPDWSEAADVIAEAKWPAIVPIDEWRALVNMLSDPSRRITESNKLKWFGSGIYRCGVPTGEVDAEGNPIVCGSGLRVAPYVRYRDAKRFKVVDGKRVDNRRFLYRCTAKAHLTISADPTDKFVKEVVAERIRDPRVIAAMHPGNEQLAGDRELRSALAHRLENVEKDYILGRIKGAQLQRVTAKITEELAEIDARLTKALQRSTSSAIFRAPDPGAAFLKAPIDVQRAVLASVINVEIQPHIGRPGTIWNPERIKITPAV